MSKIENNRGTVLVTGGSGFVAGHCILQLLNSGYTVHTTVRSLNKEAAVRRTMESAGVSTTGTLTFFEADLSSDAGWAEAVAGCNFVLHVASPFSQGATKDEEEMIGPARDGALRVLRAARDASVRRVVLTSSFAAVGYGHSPQTAPFTENDWTNLEDKQLSAYVKSKTIAEHAAWDFIKREGGDLELTVINPVGIFGPLLSPDLSGSIQLVKTMLDGGMPRLPQISFGVVDVRDVAAIHLLAMRNPAAGGERFLAVSGDPMSLRDVAFILKATLGGDSGKISTAVAPTWLLKLLSIFSPKLKGVVPDLGKVRRSTSEKARRILGWSPRLRDEAIAETGKSLISLGLVKKQ